VRQVQAHNNVVTAGQHGTLRRRIALRFAQRRRRPARSSTIELSTRVCNVGRERIVCPAMNAASSFSLIGLAAVGIFACGSDPVETKVTAVEACTALAKTTCDKAQECAPFKLATTYGDPETCRARVQIECEAKVSAPSSSQTPNRVSACASDGVGVTCADYLRTKNAPSCLLIPGGLGDNEACTFDSQCKSTFCKQLSGTGCGKCTPRQAVGASCTNTLECDLASVCQRLKCVVPADVAQGCSPEKPCVGGLKCVGGTCATPLTLNSDCKEQGEKCVDGAYCDGSTFRCTAIKQAQSGEDCGPVQGKFIRCKASAYCAPELDSVCIAAAPDEGGCDDLTGPRCLPPASCVAGKCLDPRKTACRK
jgi:hypothetical protein